MGPEWLCFTEFVLPLRLLLLKLAVYIYIGSGESYEQHWTEEKARTPEEDIGLSYFRWDIRDLERVAFHWRGVWRDGEVDADTGDAHADDAIVQRLSKGRQGRDGVGRLLEDNQELKEYEGGEA